MKKMFFYDLETTGLDYRKHAIHQISGAIVINGKIERRFNFHVKPFDGAEISDEALSVSGVTVEQIMNYPDHTQVYGEIISMLSKYVNRFDREDKFFLVGYNIHFDNDFFRRFFELNGDKYFGSWFWSNSLDLMVMATIPLAPVRHTMANFKQGTVAATLGIPIEESKLHDANYDIDVCMKIFNKVSPTPIEL